MTDVIIRHEGTIDEFTGDGILVFFGAPRWLSDHSQRAVACALQMQQALKGLNADNIKLGLPELKMGIGINAGELIVGNIGSEKRKKYGAVGSPINVAFRVEAVTRGEEILITEGVVNKLDKNVIVGSLRTQHLKGINEPMTLYKVEGMKEV
jgi:class 3 adenylate cyclase